MDTNALSPLVVVTLIVVAMVLAIILVYPWATRASQYANDPNDPPDEVWDPAEDEDEEPPDPSWYGKFHFKVEYHKEGSDHLEIYTGAGMLPPRLHRFTSEPYEQRYPGLSTTWLSKDTYKLDWDLKLEYGTIVVRDEGTVTLHKDDDYIDEVDSRFIFFWAQEVGTWSYTLKCECDGHEETDTGTFRLTSAGVIQ
jgi:hypothetical protein